MTKKTGRFGYAAEPENTETENQAQHAPTQERPTAPVTPVKAQQSALPSLAEVDAYVLPPKQHGKKKKEDGMRRTDIERTQLNVRIRPELKRLAAGRAGLEGKTLGDVVEAALVAYLKGKEGSKEEDR